MIKQHDQLVKLILIGSSGVGKSSLLTQFAQNKFSQTYLTTIGVDFRFKKIHDGNRCIKLQIWDTAGQERFRTITSAYYKGADGIIMVYDLTQPNSLQDIINFWIPQAYNYCDRNIDVLLMGNKLDCDKKIEDNKIQQLSQKYKYPNAQVSAKTAQNLQESIKAFVIDIANKKLKKLYPKPNNDVNLQSKSKTIAPQVNTNGAKKKCC